MTTQSTAVVERNSDPNNEMIVQPNGRGALRAGGQIGNKGGGRPRDELRLSILTLIRKYGMARLEEILSAPRGYLHQCPECEHSMLIQPPKTDDITLRAFDLAGKYGLGTYAEIDATVAHTLVVKP